MSGPRAVQTEIVHITTVHPRFDTRIFWRQCVPLASQAGLRVRLIVADGLGNTRRSGVEILDVGCLPPSRMMRFFVGARRVLRAMRRIDADLIQIHDPELLPVAHLLRRRGRALVYDMHEHLPAQIRNKPWIPAPLRAPCAAFVRSTERMLLAGMAVIFAEQSYARHYEWVSRHCEVQNFPDLTLIEPSRQVRRRGLNEPFVVAYLGAVTRLRGLVQAMRAIACVRAEGLDVRFVCIGPIRLDADAQTLMHQAVDAGWARFSGRVDAPECWDRISAAHCGIAALLPSPNYLGSFPTKAFEYMALGLPVILSNFPLYRDLIDETRAGLIVDPESIESIADAIRRLAKDENDRLALGAEGIRAVQDRFNASAQFSGLIDFYRSLLAR